MVWRAGSHQSHTQTSSQKMKQSLLSSALARRTPNGLSASLLGLREALLAVLLAVLPQAAKAGNISLGFDPADTVPGTLYGTAAVDDSGGIGGSGALKLNTANGQAGFLVLDDLDGGQTVGSFLATFNLRTGSATSTVLHGDGVSFSFGPDIPDDTFAFPEEGTGSGLRVSFDTFNNAGPANEAPAVKVTYGNQLIAAKQVDFLSTGTGYAAVKIEAHPEGTLDVFYGTNAVFTNLLCYVPTAGRFSLAANAGAERFVGDPVDLYWVDNLAITTKPSQSAFVQSAKPRGDSVSPDAVIAIQLHDAATHVKADSLVLKLDGTVVTRKVLSVDGVTTVTFVPPTVLGRSTVHQVTVTYADDAVPVKTSTVGYAFTVYPYATLTASYAVDASVVNKALTGFKVRTHQVSVDAGTSVERAELQFANKLQNPLDHTVLPNVANLDDAEPDGTFAAPNFIDFSANADGQGFFPSDEVFPGVVGTDQYALEITTFLDLAPGTYTFGVDAVRNYNTTAPGSFRESGFRLTAGTNPKDLFAPEIALFDKDRPEGEKVFSFVVLEAGLYPFRLLWFSGVGASSLEWYQIKADGSRILIGDTASGGPAAYRGATVTHPYVQYTTNPKPGETSVVANTPITLTLVDGSATVKTNTLQLSLNGTVVAAAIATDAAKPGLTQLLYQPPTVLPAGSTNTVRLVFSDSVGAAYDQRWLFVVAGNLAIPGLLTVEAEHFSGNFESFDLDGINKHRWVLTNTAGFSGDGAMLADPNINYNQNVDTSVEPRLDYALDFTIPGTYYVWVRALGDSAPGISQNDSVNVGIDGVLPASGASSKITGFPPGGYVWSKTKVDATPATVVVPTAGPHVINVWMREDGFLFDKLLLTTNKTYVPIGFGPAEPSASAPVLTYLRTEAGLKLSWTGGGALQSANTVSGTYSPVNGGGTSPVTVPLDQAGRFFRVAK